MLISHEVPIPLLEKSKEFNDYDYALLHLVLKDEEYKNYYINAQKSGRKVLLDNSLFELGDAMAPEKLVEGINLIKPEWYVVPDALNDADTTMERFEEWKSKWGKGLPGKTIGVVQGQTWMDQVACYTYMSKHADKIAIPCILATPYILGFKDKDDKDKVTREEKAMYGRQAFISYLMASRLWNYDKPHHLLGCTLAREFTYPLYKDPSFESLDTSNPVMAAFDGLEFKEGYGLDVKPKAKMDAVLYEKPEGDKLDLLLKNVENFRKLVS